MEKTEYRIKIDQMETLVRQGDLKGAVESVSDLNYHKIRNINVLLRVSDVCEMAGEPEKAREILEIAHEKSPMARMTIYKLALLSVKLGELEEAETYYNEFIDLAPHDGLRFIIRYTIRKAQGADNAELIDILEELCKEDFIDKWAFELACLYRENGDEQKCIDTCDKIALWFGEGPYVERALEMKMLYKPLSSEQEDQYRRITRDEDGTRKKQDLSDTIKIPKIDETPDKFDTVNLQAEIRKNIEEIMMATEKDEVSENIANIKDLVGNIPYVTAGQSALEKHKKPVEQPVEESPTPIEDSYRQYLAEEYDGQMAFNLTAHSDDDQIEGQLTIDDVLADWSRKQRAMEAALSEARRKELDEAKEEALREANQIMDRLVDISPQLEAGVAPEEILREKYLSSSDKPEKPEKNDNKPEDIMAGVNNMLQHDIDSMAGPQTAPEQPQTAEAEQEKEQEPQDQSGQTAQPADTDMQPQEEPGESDDQPDIPEEMAESVQPDEHQDSPESDEQASETEEQIDADTDIEATKNLSDITRTEPTEQIDVSGLESAIENAVLEDEKVAVDFSDDERDILNYFADIHGMKEQLLGVISVLRARSDSDGLVKSGNLTIAGGDGCGKTTLASRLVQIVQKETEKLNGEAGRITGDSINKKDLNAIISKVRGGSLMIEHAGRMNRKTAVSLALLIDNDRSGTLFILEDDEAALNVLKNGVPELWKYFTEHITIPVMTLDELVSFAKVYVLDCGYSMDDMGILALYDRISVLQSVENAVSLNEVKKIIDEGIAKYQKRSRGFFGRFSARFTDEDGRPLLQEKDIIDY